MEGVLELRESANISELIQSIRDEVTSAIRTAIINQNYNADINLSFGVIHINPQGSVSQISFNGSNVEDMDRFIVERAMAIKSENYHDIRSVIKNNPEKFNFYPIEVNGKRYVTVLKDSPYFQNTFGQSIHSPNVEVQYASKFLFISYNYSNDENKRIIYAYCIGLFDSKNTANMLLKSAGRIIGNNKTVFYCFSNTRPEEFLHIGLTKPDFSAYHPEINPKAYNFYEGLIVLGIIKINIERDKNSKVKIKDTKRKLFKHIIEMQYSSTTSFCKIYEIDEKTLNGFLLGHQTEIKYINGNIITTARLEQMLNIPINISEESLKDKNLLTPIEYKDIPDGDIA